MKYCVKDVIIDLKNLSTNVYYVGKDGYVQDDSKYCDGWSRKGFAINYIEKDVKDFALNCCGVALKKNIDANHYLESGRYLHHLELVECND